MKIIFLDIDGVLYQGAFSDREHQNRMSNQEIPLIKELPKIANKLSSTQLTKLCNYDLSAMLGFDESAVQLLIRLCEETGAKIVLTTSWRVGRDLTYMQNLFSFWDFASYIIDLTPRLFTGRKSEIDAWLQQQTQEISSFIVLDDDKFPGFTDYGEKFIYCRELFCQRLYEQSHKLL
jgi:hypothetical protein